VKQNKKAAFILLVPLLCNLYFMGPHFIWSARLFVRTLPMNPLQRRMAFMPSLYHDMLEVQQRVPPDATIWYVAPLSPHELLYFLYPRVLRWGSPYLSDREKIRRAHPQDWVITNHSANPATDTVELFSPLQETGPRKDKD
jgi:hypothetical protein